MCSNCAKGGFQTPVFSFRREQNGSNRLASNGFYSGSWHLLVGKNGGSSSILLGTAHPVSLHGRTPVLHQVAQVEHIIQSWVPSPVYISTVSPSDWVRGFASWLEENAWKLRHLQVLCLPWRGNLLVECPTSKWVFVALAGWGSARKSQADRTKRCRSALPRILGGCPWWSSSLHFQQHPYQCVRLPKEHSPSLGHEIHNVILITDPILILLHICHQADYHSNC